MWITNGSQATVAIIWAKTGALDDPKSIRGFIVPTDTKGFTAKDQKGKLSLRASDTSEIHLADVHLPKDAILPESGGLKSPLMCLTQARYGIAWGAIGAAMACYDEALRYAKHARDVRQARSAGTQIQQVRLAEMLTEITKAQFLTLQLGRLKDRGHDDAASRCRSPSGTTWTWPASVPAKPGACSAPTASWSSTTRCGTWPTSSRSTPTRAPTTCTR